MRRTGWRAASPATPKALLHRRVVRFEVVVAERPVVDAGAVDRAALGAEAEVLLPEAGQLGVGVDPAPADGRREVVDLAGEEAVAVGRGAAVRARLEDADRGRGGGGG